ncbi:hypothetical protein K0M31_005159 [Melipona bicolor]|uniref:Uncharacterized protein n=1 Tax=Melipona bicolor TaxID=60889 RepID=A0AA40KMB3_9HYME|nr:hypothetical protein K0M31_005159 [Melipona bicolor]
MIEATYIIGKIKLTKSGKKFLEYDKEHFRLFYKIQKKKIFRIPKTNLEKQKSCELVGSSVGVSRRDPMTLKRRVERKKEEEKRNRRGRWICIRKTNVGKRADQPKDSESDRESEVGCERLSRGSNIIHLPARVPRRSIGAEREPKKDTEKRLDATRSSRPIDPENVRVSLLLQSPACPSVLGQTAVLPQRFSFEKQLRPREKFAGKTDRPDPSKKREEKFEEKKKDKKRKEEGNDWTDLKRGIFVDKRKI